MKIQGKLVTWLFVLAILLSACARPHPDGSMTTWPKPSATPVLIEANQVTSPSEVVQALPTQTPEPNPEPILISPTQGIDTPDPIPEIAPPIRFAVIGDYGGGGEAERDVADLVKSWNVDFIITVGDNNYPDGAAETIDDNIGQFYHKYIYPYPGAFGAGADQLRFFPTLGNHDWNTQKAQPYFDYFTLPGNERYYDFTWGPVHFFALNSDSREPDGVSRKSIQAQWLAEQLAVSESPWKLVYFHHAPYSSGLHGPVDWMRWPFAAWGASTVLSGHDHTYERLLIDGIPYFVNGLGGGEIYYFNQVSEGSQFRYAADYGAMLVAASDKQIDFEFYNRSGELIDRLQLTK